jgi:dTDP-4-dehydrorhamnose reductase
LHPCAASAHERPGQVLPEGSTRLLRMKILLIDKTSQLGADILENNDRHEICAPELSVLDVSLREKLDAVVSDFKPDVIVNTTDFHDVPLCEADPLSAFIVNCVAVRTLAMACNRTGSLLVTVSTDYVFNGEKNASYLEDDKPAPLQMYGISRLAGEYIAMAAAPEHALIVRTCGLYGLVGAEQEGGNFVDQRIRDAQSQAYLRMGADQIVSPTYTQDLSIAVLQLIEHPQRTPGIYHLVNEGKCSWYEFTKAIYEIMGYSVKMKPIDRGQKGADIGRPIYSALANTRARSLGIILPHWKDALARYLKAKYTREDMPAQTSLGKTLLS